MRININSDSHANRSCDQRVILISYRLSVNGSDLHFGVYVLNRMVDTQTRSMWTRAIGSDTQECRAEPGRLTKRGEGGLVRGVDGGLTRGAGATAGVVVVAVATTGTTAGTTTSATGSAGVTTGLTSGLVGTELAVNLDEDLLLLGLGVLGLGLLGLAGEERVGLLTLEDLALGLVVGDLADLLLGENTTESGLGLLGEVLVESLGVVLLLLLGLSSLLGLSGSLGSVLLALLLG